MKKYLLLFALFPVLFFGCAGGGLYKESSMDIPSVLGAGGSFYFHIPVESHTYVMSAIEADFKNRGVDISPVLNRCRNLWGGCFPGRQSRSVENLRLVLSGKYTKLSLGTALGISSGWEKIKNRNYSVEYYSFSGKYNLSAWVPESGLLLASSGEQEEVESFIESYYNPVDIFSRLFLLEGQGDSIGIYFPEDKISRFFLGNFASDFNLPVKGVEVYFRLVPETGIYNIEMRFIPLEENVVRGLQALIRILVRNVFEDSGLNMDITSSDIYVRGLTINQEDLALLILSLF